MGWRILRREWWPGDIPIALLVCGLVMPVIGAAVYRASGRRGGDWWRIPAGYYVAVVVACELNLSGHLSISESPLATWAPIGLLSLGVAIGLAFGLFGGRQVIVLARAKRRQPKVCCTGCRYDLTGNVSGVCPECGTARRSDGTAG